MRSETLELAILGLIVLAGLGTPLAVIISACMADAKREELQKKAVASAYRMEGQVARFGTVSAYEGEVAYTVQLEGNTAVYRVSSDGLSVASYGELTRPGDFVTFQVLPGLSSVRDFYNPAAAKA
jgi:hypothetical protein